MGRRLATFGSVNTATCENCKRYLRPKGQRTDFGRLHVLQVHTDLTGNTVPKAKIGCGNLSQDFNYDHDRINARKAQNTSKAYSFSTLSTGVASLRSWLVIAWAL